MASSRELSEQTECWGTAEQIVGQISGFSSADRAVAKTPIVHKVRRDIDQLAKTVEAEIIPRLLLAHSLPVATVAAQVAPSTQPTKTEIETLASLVLSSDIGAGLAFIEEVRERGVSTETVLLNLLPPAAKLLGEYWHLDLCDFTEVTLGLSRLQRMVRDLSPFLEPRSETGAPDPRSFMQTRRGRALLAPSPGEQHTFGLCIVEEFFRKEGWEVWGGVAISRKKLLEVLRAEAFDVLGFSMSCDRFLDEFIGTLGEARKVSRNPNLIVLVGGPLFIERPELVAEVGADATAADGRQAVQNAQDLFETSKPETSRSTRGN